jgi:hypothetical protein
MRMELILLLTVGWIPEKFVYEGYPLVINGDSGEMKFVSFFYSYFKIDALAKTTYAT